MIADAMQGISETLEAQPTRGPHENQRESRAANQ